MEEKQISVRKWYSLDENIKYPNCWKCNRELSPYVIMEAEDESLNGLLELGVIRGFIEGKPISLLCKNCCSIHLLDK